MGGPSIEGHVRLDQHDNDVKLVLRALAKLGREVRLTPTLERRLFELGLGLSNQEIATRNGITVNTVKTEVRTLFGKLDLDCRHEIQRAVRRTLVSLERGMEAEEVEGAVRCRLQ